MIRWRVSGSVTEIAKSIILFAANATKSVPRSKVLFLGMFALLLAAVAVQILFRADMPSITADGTLNCYDSAGKLRTVRDESSGVRLTINGRTTGAPQPASWTT